jgi:ribulose 1,5-bisphosphate synthetase/thiazole synthase
MMFEEAGPSFGGVFGGARVASDMADVVAVCFVERNDFVGGGEKASGGFVFDEYGVSVSAEKVFEK